MDIIEYESENKLLDILNSCIEKVNILQDALKNKKFDNIIVTNTYQTKIDNLKCFDFVDLINKINIEHNSIKSLIKNNASIWLKFNEQYQKYYINRLGQIKNKAEQFKNIDVLNVKNEYYYSQIYDVVNSFYLSMKRDSAFELYENFKYGDKNYILFGKNGAGKTTLLNKISSEFLNLNTIVLNATRDIKYADNPYHYQNEINLLNALKTQENGKSLFLLGKILSDEDYKQLRDLIKPENSIETKVISIFNQLGLDRKLVLNQHGSIFLGEENISEYLVSNASDGERSSIYILLSVLLSPFNSFIFIDEPENHLNGALMRKLFDLLERERPDLKFIFATHNIQFIQSRQNVELIYLEKTSMHMQWKFKKFENYKDLPLEIVLNIEGTNDNIIFCEGEDRSSLDCKLYEILFSRYEIMPAHGCENVEKQTEMVNQNKLIFKKEAKGIVDNDFRTEENIKILNGKKVYVLPVNEIENIFILPCCLEKAMQMISCETSLDDIKEEIIKKIKHKSVDIKKDFATKLLRNIQFKNKFMKIDNIEENLDSLLSSNKKQFLESYKSFEVNLNNSIETKDYEMLMKLVPAKMIISDVSKLIGFENKDVFTKNILLKVKQDSELQKKLLEIINL